MIAFVFGKFVVKNPTQVIVDVNGVGYDCNISLNTYSSISNLNEGKLFTYLHITENSHTLYGFADVTEKTLFLQLISVSGVGASTARVMLSGMKPDELIQAIVQGNVKQLESVKGIGKKTAERLIVELKDKLSKHSIDADIYAGISFKSNHESDAIQALVSLGIAKPTAENAIRKVKSSNEHAIQLEDLIKLALKNL
jgi:Holliday junction DNA helicase RuvA